MTQQYTALTTTMMAHATTCLLPDPDQRNEITYESPAKEAMTDLTRVTAITIDADASLHEANQKMIANHVRLLFVTDAGNHILGIITATDTLGEKPVQYMHRIDCNYQDICVQDIMTPQSELEVMQMVDVARARIGDIIKNLKRDGRQHALVVEIDETTMQESVRGIFSSSQIARQLGITLNVTGRANTFAELEQALMAG